MSVISVFVWATGAYYTLGILVASRFVFFTAPQIDPAYKSASMRVRVLFFPGAVSIWPLILTRTSALRPAQSKKHS